MANNSSGTFDYDLLCMQARSIFSDIAFQCVLGLEIIFALPAIFLNVFLMSIIFRLTIYHSNLRCLLFHHSFNLAFFSVSTMAKAFYIATAYNDPCALITTLFSCKLLELVILLPLINNIYSFVTVCLERLYATINFRTYDNASRTPWLAIFLIPLVWFISLVYQLQSLPSIPRNRYLPICANLLSMTPIAATSSLTQSLIMEATALCLVLILYFINTRKLKESVANRAQFTLATRFQISQNIEVNSLLIPSLLSHAACFVPIIAYLILITYGLTLSLNSKMLLIHVQYVWILFYATAHPLLALTRNAHLKKIYKNLIPINLRKQLCRNRKKPVEVLNDADVHFKSLEAMWAIKL